MSDSGWQPSLLYPDPAIITLDPRFEKIRPPFNASVECLYSGCRWSEGPVWFGDGRFVLWSDIPNNRILKWEEETGTVSVFRKPSNNSNGNTRDRQGRLVTCEHGGRQVTRTEHDGTITVLCNREQVGNVVTIGRHVVQRVGDEAEITAPSCGDVHITNNV